MQRQTLWHLYDVVGEAFETQLTFNFLSLSPLSTPILPTPVRLPDLSLGSRDGAGWKTAQRTAWAAASHLLRVTFTAVPVLLVQLWGKSPHEPWKGSSAF